MRRRICTCILTIAMVSAVLGGCGKGNGEKPVSEAEMAEENRAGSEENNEEKETEAAAESVAEADRELEDSSVKEDWFAEKGFAVTPQGDFTLSCRVLEGVSQTGEADTVLGTENVSGNIVITETMEDGYRKVEAVMTYDLSGLEQYGIDGLGRMLEASEPIAFDRYTGTFLNEMYAPPELEECERELKENSFDFENQEILCIKQFDTLGTGTLSANTYTYQIIVLCSEDYDGVVFGMQPKLVDYGYIMSNGGNQSSSFYDIIHGAADCRTEIDVEPILSDDCIFFSASDK